MSEPLNFNLKRYREKLEEKYSKSPVENRFDSSINEGNKKTPIKREKITPNLDSISNKLQEYSSKQRKNDSFLFKSGRSNNNSSPNRYSGMHQKISSINSSSPQPYQSNLSINIHQHSTSQFNGVSSPQRSFISSPNHNSNIITDRLEQQQQYKKDDNEVDISRIIPLHEIVNMRNKLENAKINSANITATYLTELVKLAHVISTQIVKQKRS